MKTSKINTFLFFKLPAAWFCGVRVKEISEKSCITTVKHRWVNQNPFKSMFWAVQGMAAELSTGTLVMQNSTRKGHKISMLVISNSAVFYKKARGRINFRCDNGDLVKEAVEKALETGLPQKFILKSIGKDIQNDVVSTFDFQWSIKVK